MLSPALCFLMLVSGSLHGVQAVLALSRLATAGTHKSTILHQSSPHLAVATAGPKQTQTQSNKLMVSFLGARIPTSVETISPFGKEIVSLSGTKVSIEDINKNVNLLESLVALDKVDKDTFKQAFEKSLATERRSIGTARI